MEKNVFHNKNFTEESLLKKSTQKNVDINKLLNRVKLDEQNQTLQKFIFFAFGIILIGALGFFLSIVR